MNYYKHFVIAAIILFHINPTALFSQSLNLSFGPIFTHTNAIVPVVNGKDDFENTDYTFTATYEHYIKEKWSLRAAHSKYNGCTYILFEEGGYIGGGGIILATGFCGGVVLRRYDVGAVYSLTSVQKKFYFKPSFGISLQTSQLTGVEYWNDGLPVNGPDYFELEPISAVSKKTIQPAPILGIHTGFVFWKRLDIGLNIQGVYAFKSYQKMYLKYQYKGEIQPTAEYESTGTGLFVSLGIGYRFAKWIR